MYTAESIIQDAAQALSKFGRFIKLTEEDSNGLIEMASNVKRIMNNASNEIYRVSSEFKKSLSNNPSEHPVLLDYMNEMTGIFQRVSKFHLDFSMILNNNFIEPLKQFQDTNVKHNRKIFKDLEMLVTSLEKQKKQVKTAREAYYQFCSNAEKSEERLKIMIDKGNINKKDLTKETEKNAQLKVYAQEARLDYETKCKESSLIWQEFREKFFTHFETFDLREENRIDIIKRKTVALGTDLKNFHKNENPISDLKKFKEIDNLPSSKKPKSIVDLIFGGQSLEKYKMERREDFITYEKFKIEREQHMFDESFYVVDMEDASEEEQENLRLMITLIFNNFMSGIEMGSNSRGRGREREVEESTDSSSNSLFDDSQMVNTKKAEALFHKASLRDMFIKECVKRIPEKRQPVLISQEAFTNLSAVLKAIVTHMSKTNERDPAKFIDVIRVLNTFYCRSGADNKKYLFQVINDVPMFRDIVLWSHGYKCLLKKKKMERDNSTKPQGTILNPWRVIHGIQSIIVRKNHEEEQQTDTMLKTEMVDLILYYLSNFSLPIDIASEILSIIVKENEISTTVLASMIDQLENSSMSKDLAKFITQKKSVEALRERMGVQKSSDASSDKMVAEKPPYSDRAPTERTRKVLYQAILDIKHCGSKYLGASADNIQLEESLEEVIKMDVVRSFPDNKDFDPASLRRLLKNVAIEYRDSASYCQGMNYVVGYFLIEFQKEEIAYKLFAQLLEKHMMPIFTDNFTHLQSYFYVLGSPNQPAHSRPVGPLQSRLV